MARKIEKIKNKRKPLSKKKLMLKQGIALSRIFLSEIVNAAGWIMDGGYGGLAEYEDRKKRQRAYEARQLVYEEREWMRSLERRKLIEIKRIGEKLMVRLTAKGWQQVLRDQIKCTRERCKDGVCVVIFDVPESERGIRDTLRGILAECGFTMVQKSVWMTDKDVLVPLCALLQGSNLHQWVRIILGNEMQQWLPKRTLIRARAYINSARAKTHAY